VAPELHLVCSGFLEHRADCGYPPTSGRLRRPNESLLSWCLNGGGMSPVTIYINNMRLQDDYISITRPFLDHAATPCSFSRHNIIIYCLRFVYSSDSVHDPGIAGRRIVVCIALLFVLVNSILSNLVFQILTLTAGKDQNNSCRRTTPSPAKTALHEAQYTGCQSLATSLRTKCGIPSKTNL
jgi:hypothetical protein